MMSNRDPDAGNDDDVFFEALAGRSVLPDDSDTAEQARQLRSALRAYAQQRAGADGDPDRAALRAAAQRAGVLVAKRQPACAGCGARWTRLRALMSRPRVWGSAAAGAGALVLAISVLPPPAEQPPVQPAPVWRGPEVGKLWRLTVSDPRERRDVLADQLLQAGAQVRRYEHLGRFGIDTELPQPLPPVIEAALRAHAIQAPVAGASLRIEFQSADR